MAALLGFGTAERTEDDGKILVDSRDRIRASRTTCTIVSKDCGVAFDTIEAYEGRSARQSVEPRSLGCLNGHLDVAVVGAGPFGLSVAAHLQDRAVRTFGAEMAHVEELHAGRDAPSLGLGRDLAVRARGLGTIDHWVSATGGPRDEPIPLDLFLRYSAWFADEFVADRDPSDVAQITPSGSGFHLVTKAEPRSMPTAS